MAVFDPIIDALVGGSGNSNKAEDVRSALQGFSKLAEEQNIAVLGIHHFSKAQTTGGAPTQDKVLGSQAWVNKARAVIVCTRTKEGQYLLVPAKSNLGIVPHAVEYRIEHDKKYGTQSIFFGHLVEGALAALDAPASNDESISAVESAQEYIKALLCDVPSLTWNEMLKINDEDGKEYTKATLRRARDRLRKEGLIAASKAGFQGEHKWRLVTPQNQP